MVIWLKKLFVATVAVMTLGFYVPPIDLDINADANNEEAEAGKKSLDTNNEYTYESGDYLEEFNNHSLLVVDPTEDLLEEAKNRTIEKLGPRILTQIDQEMNEEVFPNLELVVKELIEMYDSDSTFNLSIIEHKTPGYGEKIFDLFDEESEEIIAKFHVRRENRPQDGHWFNFHYHLADDDFNNHYVIAEIYWSKNTPPKWMS